MQNKNLIPLTRMKPGQSGLVCKIQGGFGMINRLNALGIVTGKKVTKISSMIARGPVTIEVDRVQVAIGFSMAGRILIDLNQSA